MTEEENAAYGDDEHAATAVENHRVAFRARATCCLLTLGANHVHCVIRDLKNDFGDDLLRQHYEKHHKN